MLWDSSRDTISFQNQHFDSTPDSLTKHKVLSIASQLFDGLGLVLPPTVVTHLFIVELWKEKFRWDQPLTPVKIHIWKNIEKDLSAASCFQFLCWINFNSDEPVYLHMLADASILVIGAVAYISQDAKSFLLGSRCARSFLD